MININITTSPDQIAMKLLPLLKQSYQGDQGVSSNMVKKKKTKSFETDLDCIIQELAQKVEIEKDLI